VQAFISSSLSHCNEEKIGAPEAETNKDSTAVHEYDYLCEVEG
jgi:hypothetical protein